MSSLLEAAGILLALGACEHVACSAEEVDEKAAWIVAACGEGWPSELTGERCVRLAAVVWALEGGQQFLEYPSGRWRGSGRGPMQLTAKCFHNSRIGRVCLPPHELLGGPAAIRHGVWLLRVKAVGARTDRALFRRWNGGGSRSYAERAEALARTVR